MARIPLSHVDQIFVGANAYPINFVFRYEKGCDPNRLYDSLVQTLQDFPPLTSCVEFDTATQRWFFAPSGKAPAFSTRGATTVDASLDTVITMPNEPLIKVVFSEGNKEDRLGVSISHAVADGFSYFFFMSAWFAKLAGRPHPQPMHNRADLDAIGRNGTINQESPLTPATFFASTGLAWAPEISRDHIGELFFKRSMYSAKPPIEGASENALLAADCLQTWLTSSPKPLQQVQVACAVDLRQRVPAIPATYFGNAICGAGSSWDMESYRKLSTEEVAKQIHRSVSQTDTARAKATLSTLAQFAAQEGPQGLPYLHVAHPENGILVTNLSRLPLSTLDCGAGAPFDLHILTKAPNTFAVTRLGDWLFVNSCERKVM